MDKQDPSPPSPISRIVPNVITVVCLGISIYMASLIFPLGKSTLIVFIGYVWTTLMMGAVAKFPSSAGTTVDAPIGAKVEWRFVFMISAIFTMIMAVVVGATELLSR